MRHVVIYVPGLGDSRLYSGIQRAALLLWRASYIQPHYFAVKWGNAAESYEAKLERLLAAIDDASRSHTVSLVAASAGSSLALTAFSKRSQAVRSVVSICGKINNPNTVSDVLFAMNPAFQESIENFQVIEPTLTTADRKKILIVRANRDNYVSATDGEVAGAYTHRMQTAGHAFSIFMALTIFRWPLLRFITRSKV